MFDRLRFGVSARRRVIDAAVDTVCAAGSSGSSGVCSIEALASAWAVRRQRPLQIVDAPLQAGVFGQWLSYPDRDVICVQRGVVERDRTIAHELGHMVFGHRGTPVGEYAALQVKVASPGLVAHMLARSCADAGLWSDDEVAAEFFAGMLMRRMQRLQAPGVEHYLYDAFG